jgi:hypothetical protein
MRMHFLTRTALSKYRAQLPGFELPPGEIVTQKTFDEESAKFLENMADRIEGKIGSQEADLQKAFEQLQRTVRTLHREELQETFPRQLQTLLELSNRLKELGTFLSGRSDRCKTFEFLSIRAY